MPLAGPHARVYRTDVSAHNKRNARGPKPARGPWEQADVNEELTGPSWRRQAGADRARAVVSFLFC